MIIALIIIVTAVLGIALGIPLYKSRTHRKKIEKLIVLWKKPTFSQINEFETVINKLSDKTKKPTGLYLISETYFHKTNRTDLELKKLREIYFELISKYPEFEKSDDVLFKLANLYFFDYFDFIESIKFYENLLTKYPNSKWVKVVTDRLELIKSAYPNEEPALKKYALAEKHFEAQEFDKTIESLKYILSVHPNSKLAAMASYFLGDIYFFKRSDYMSALDFYTKLIERSPQHKYAGSSQFKIGEIYRKLQKISEAITAYKKFLENYNDYQYTDYAQYYIGQCYEEQKDWVLALRTYKLLVANYSESIWVGIALSKIKSLEKLKQ